MAGILKSMREGLQKRESQDDYKVVYPTTFPEVLMSGYTRLSDNTEFQTGINVIADLISNMTIALMESEDGIDRRLRNGLTDIVDINPNKYQTRKDFMFNLTKTLLIEGNQVTRPNWERKTGYLKSLTPYAPNRVSYNIGQESYNIVIDNDDIRKPENLLHFKLNQDPNNIFTGTGYTVSLKPILDNLKQATTTKKSYMSSKYQPPLVVSVEADNEAFTTPEGRKLFAETYLKTSGSGEPWILPANNMSVESVKPLTLKDIAINETVEIDKKTVAAVLGIPAFLLGVGEFNEKEYNNFINTKIMSIAKVIEQELTKKLLYSPKLYFKFNNRSLLSYSMTDMSDIGKELVKLGVLTGNEFRDMLGMNYVDEPSLNEYVMLENFIPREKLGNQNKLGGDEDE